MKPHRETITINFTEAQVLLDFHRQKSYEYQFTIDEVYTYHRDRCAELRRLFPNLQG